MKSEIGLSGGGAGATLTRLAAGVLLILASSGCKAFLNNLAESGPWGTMCHGAPTIPNPAKAHAPTPLAVRDQGGAVEYSMSKYSDAEMCFDFTAPYEPSSVEAMKYTVEALKSSLDDRDTAPKDNSSSVRVVSSTSEVRVVKKYDSRLNEMVEHPETFYTTKAQVCFSKPRAVSEETHVMLLYPAGVLVNGLDSYAAWQLQ